jgi:glycosyltransferase involved in cell wall biosynthesis
MRILHICDGMPGTTVSGGGHVFYWQNLAALVELGHEVHLLSCNATWPAASDVTSRVASVSHAVTIPPSKRSIDYALARVFRAETLPFRFPDWGGLAEQVAQACRRLAPDLIWADHIQSLLLAPNGPPIIYGHLDFLYKLQPVRRAMRKGRLRRPDAIRSISLERLERELCRKARHVVSVSNSDLAIFDSLGVPAVYMPVTGGYIPPRSEPPHPRPRAFLFGRPNTAMNMQRRNLRDDIWPHLRQDIPIEWHQVGELPASSDDSWQWLEQHFTLHGFIDDLESLFRPGDLCLIPYRDDTGFRAKFTTAAAHGMVNIGYEETFRCATEFVPGHNCLAARSGQHFAELLHQYAEDSNLRQRLSVASRVLYEERFTLAAHLPTYDTIVRHASRGVPHA